MVTIYSDWRQLPFREIWVVDTEFYPGPGLANGGVEGDTLTPLCLVALEMRSDRLVRLWQDELGLFPAYRLDPDVLIVGYVLPAEFGFHIAKGWGEPACALDAYVEFRHYVNNGAIKGGDRDKGFYGIDGALRYFLENEIDHARKQAMRDRILQGPPFSALEKRDSLDYCEDDVRKLARLVPTSFQQSDRCCMRCFAPRFSGPQRSRSAAAPRSIGRFSGVPANTGAVCRSTSSPSLTVPSAVTRSSMVFRTGARNDLPIWCGAMACPGREPRAEHLMRGTKHFGRWPLDIRRSSRYESYVTHSRSCGLMTFRWVMMAATELHCGPTEPRPGAARRAIQSTSLAPPSGRAS